MFSFDPAQVQAAVAGSGALQMAARFWTATVVLRLGAESYALEFRDGQVTEFRRDDSVGDGTITVAGPAESWAKMLEAVPPPGFQDPLFVEGGSGIEVKGDGITAIGPYFYAVQELIDILRRIRNGTPAPQPLPEVDRDFDDAVGRYMYVRIQGVQYRIYYEEAGTGDVPLILQHTAGSDSRQWRHVLEDPDYQKLYRIIAYDLPFHGKSLPPTSECWWERPYKLTRSFLMDAVVAISNKLGLDRPVYMGCSVGGMLAPDLAYYHPEQFRAVIALNGSLGIDPAQREAIQSALALWSSPRVSAQWTMALMKANMAPTSKEALIRETIWVYSQGGPCVNEGDLNYYAVEHDLTAEQAAQIDTSVVGVYLLTGEYDALATSGATERLAKAIKGSHFVVVPKLGHFGPADSPECTKPALLPVLQEIARNRKLVAA